MSWWKIRFHCDFELSDTAAWFIAEALDHPVEVRDPMTMSASHHQAEIVIAFDQQPDDAIAQTIRDALDPIGLAHVDVETTSSQDESWRDGWKAFFKGQHLTPDLWVGPPWEKKPDVEAAIHIEPGQAFGTGTHETTQGCLITLWQLLREKAPCEVLDVGCGSAVLSIAAALLGHRVDAIDIDNEALGNARDNIALNDVGQVISVRHGGAAICNRTYPVVVANILAPILVAEAAAISACCDGDLILSGLLEQHLDAICAAYKGWHIVEHRTRGEWQILRLQRV
ncbi:MAG: 50S ribosomal protein L11 methyltransferase [Myxococcota bacterium]|nr:50S ribosomal protein L11 methyltransferase [Myxococcota bacterium]